MARAARSVRDDSDSDRDLPGQDAEGLHWPSAAKKWWFVPDEKIEAFVASQSHADGAGAAKIGGASSLSARGLAPASRVDAPARADALNSMSGTQRQSSASSLRRKIDWKVPDKVIQDMVMSMSSASPKTPRSATRLSLAGTMNLTTMAVQSARLSENINIWIFFLDSADSMRLTVSPWLRVGPLKASPEQGSATASTPRAEREATSQSGEYAPGWNFVWKQSLKGMIEELAEIEIPRQKLFFNHSPLANDGLSLKSYGIGEGDQVVCRIDKHRFHAMEPPNRDFYLACSRRATSARDRFAGKYDSWSLLNSKHLKHSRSCQGKVYMQPKWVTSTDSDVFVPVDGDGSHKPKPDTQDQSIWVPDPNDDKLRAVRVRMGVIC